MKALLLFSLVSLTLAACDSPTTAAEAAKRQRYANAGGRLLKLGVKTGILSPDEAAEIGELGMIVLNPAPAAAPVIEATSGK